MLLDLDESLGKELARRDVDLLDCLEQLDPGAREVAPLLEQEAVPFLLLGVLLERQQVDRAQRLQLLARLLELPAHCSLFEPRLRRFRRPGLRVHLVFASQALERAVQLAARLHARQLELVQQLGQLGVLETPAARLLLRRLHGRAQSGEALLQLDDALALARLALEQAGEPR